MSLDALELTITPTACVLAVIVGVSVLISFDIGLVEYVKILKIL